MRDKSWHGTCRDATTLTVREAGWVEGKTRELEGKDGGVEGK